MDSLKEWCMTVSACSAYVTVGLVLLIWVTQPVYWPFYSAVIVVVVGVSVSIGLDNVQFEEFTKLRSEVSSTRADVKALRTSMSGIPSQEDLSQLKVSISSIDISRAEVKDNLAREISQMSDRLLKAYDSQLTKAVGDVQSKGFSLVFRSMPYSDKFSEFSDGHKVAYFDAAVSGDWTVVNRLLLKVQKVT